MSYTKFNHKMQVQLGHFFGRSVFWSVDTEQALTCNRGNRSKLMRTVLNWPAALIVLSFTQAVAQTEIQLHDNFTLAYVCKAETAGGLAYRNKKWAPAEMKTSASLDFTLIMKKGENLSASQPYCATLLELKLNSKDKPRERPMCVSLRFKSSEEEIEKICHIKKGINVRLECEEYVFYEDGSYFRFGHRDPVATKQASIIQGQCKYSKQETATARDQEPLSK
jgi:hypothetical protein